MKSRASETGAILISALAVVAVMSAVALTALGGMAASIRDTVRREEAEQARLHAVGASHWVAARLGEAIRSGDQSTEQFGQRRRIAFEDGEASAVVSDGANCFNLNSLFTTSDSHSGASEILAALLNAEGIPAHRAQRMVSDIRRAVRSGLFADLADERLQGIDGDILIPLADLLCVRPDTHLRPLNINTLEADRASLLAAYAGSTDTRAARRLLQSRPMGGFSVIDEAISDPFFAGRELPTLLALSSSIYDISVSVRYQGAAVEMSTTVERTGPGLVLRRISQTFFSG